MESLLIEQSLTPRKQIRNSKWKTHQHVSNNNPHHLHQIAQFSNYKISRQGSLTQNYAPPPQQQPPQVMMDEFELMMMMMMHGGSFFNNHHAPPYHHHHVSNSLPPMSSLAHHHQPTLHPLPVVSRPTFRSLPPHPPLSSRKTPSKHKTSPKKENKKGNEKNNNNNNNNNSNSVQLSAGKHVKTKATTSSGPSKESGPNHETLAKDVTQMLLADNVDDEMDRFSGSVFSIAPPPSSLPFPKFFLRRQPPCDKHSCNTEAAADVCDRGASDNVSKLLKLR